MPMHRFWLLAALALAGCPATNTPPDAFIRDAGPPDPNASTNCRAALLLPRGTYWIGSDVPSPGGLVTNGPAFQATLSSDGWVARFESTNACYLACLESGGCSNVPSPYLRDPSRTRHPVYSLEYGQAVSYCTWLGGRLLTDAEWVGMARGPSGKLLPWYPDPADPRRPEEGPFGEPREATDVGGRGASSPVGSHPDARGTFGHEDVIGNAPEWVRGTAVYPYPPGPIIDPIFEDPDFPRIARIYPNGPSDGDGTARCLFTSPPEPLYVEE